MRSSLRVLPLVVLLAACQTVQATQSRIVAAHQRTEAEHAASAAASSVVQYADGCPRTEDRPPIAGTDTTWYAVQVDAPAQPVGERPAARLPHDAEIFSGRVDLQFAVDASGCVDMRTVTVLESNNRDASDAAKKVLPLYRYSAAQKKGAPVRQWVQERVRVAR